MAGLQNIQIAQTPLGFPQVFCGSALFGRVYQGLTGGDAWVLALVNESAVMQWMRPMVQWLLTCFQSSVVGRFITRLFQAVSVLPIAVVLFFAAITLLTTGKMALLMVGLVGLAVLDALVYRRCWLTQWTVLDAWVALFFVSAVWAAFVSSVQPQSLNGLAKMGMFALGYGVCRQMVQYQPKSIQWVLGGFVVLGLVQAVIGYGQLNAQTLALATWQDPNINPELKMTRIFGTLKPLNPNLLAGFIVPIAGLAMHWAAVSLYTLIDGVSLWAGQFFGKSSGPIEVISLEATQSLSKGNWFKTIILSSVALILMWASVATGSRGAYMAIAMMAGVLFLWHGHLIFRRPIWRSVGLKVGWLALAVGAISVVGLVLIQSDALRHRVFSIFSMYEDSSIAYRFHVYQAVWRMIQDNWLFGIGPGNQTFQQVYGLYMVPGYNALGAYSVPLEIWLEQGLLGLLCYVLMIITILFRGLHALDAEMNGHRLSLMTAVLIALMGVWVYGWFDTIWYRPIVQWQCGCLLAMFAALTQSASSSEESAE